MKTIKHLDLLFVHAGREADAATAFARAEANEEPRGSNHPMSAMESAYGVDFSMNKPFGFAAGIAFISVSGYLMHRFGSSWGYVTGYDSIRMQMAAALADEDVTSIVLDVNSGGGMCSGCFELADWIYSQRGVKPMESIVDASAYSAAYAIASSADTITITPTGGAGSIGVVATHFDISGAMEKYGEKVSFVYAGKTKVDGNQYEALTPRARAKLQSQVDALYNQFTATVSRNRGLSVETVRNTEAEVYTASEAVAMGLADRVQAPQSRLAALLSGENPYPEDTNMPQANTSQAPVAETPVAPVAETPVAQAPVAPVAETPAAPVDAVAGERTRIAAILKLPEAEGNPALANHFALSTNMTVEEAQAALSVAVVPAAAAPAAPVVKGNSFENAMATGNPDVGAGNLAPAGGDDVDAVQEVLSAYSIATNTPLNK